MTSPVHSKHLWPSSAFAFLRVPRPQPAQQAQHTMATSTYDAYVENRFEKDEQKSESSDGEALDLECELSPEAFAALTLFMAEKQEVADLPPAYEKDRKSVV